ncbi:hypothetical protein HG264_02070 [Pseudomonas sp. gcc21]|uniref:hypothetical protein n=1 Tax=Pseudomonas sp. gcc21 TaxID=2726989 RepID=UPI001451856A|nr:hypothetical protein [Pseudomonas sp. gcc21]QJD57780.1 hypothetical protein HG264_02070 [Pseudomonas sp. gcc21]
MIVFIAAVSFFVLASETYLKNHRFVLLPQAGMGELRRACCILGGFIAPGAALGMIFWGFYRFRWWLPLAALLFGSFLCTLFRQRMTASPVCTLLCASGAGFACAGYVLTLPH